MFNFNLFFHPEKELENELKKTSILRGILNYALIPIIIAFIIGVIIFLVSPMISSLAALNPPVVGLNPVVGILAGIAPLAFIILPIIAFIVIVIGILLFNAFLYIGLKITGGTKGSFAQQFYLTSVFMPVFYLFLIAFGILYLLGLLLMVVLVGVIFTAIAAGLLVAIIPYTSYIYWLALKTVHKGMENKQLIIGITLGYAIMIIVVSLITGLIVGALLLGLGLLPSGNFPAPGF